ncbi:MAG: TlpA family protein disulfide reductase [Planctomycetota bacterium]|jgi:thiol-disulfide isomerase/thioredoxin
MKVTILFPVLILVLSLTITSVSAQQTQQDLQQHLTDQKKQITELKTETIQQRKQIVELKSQVFDLKFGTQDKSDTQQNIAAEMQKLNAEIVNLKSEIKRLTALCNVAGIDPNSDPNKLQVSKNASNTQRPNRIVVGQQFPRLKFKNLQGTATDIDKLQGKVVLIDFWATWCPPCRDEMPAVVSLYNRYRNRGFEIIGISLDSDINKLNTYLAEKQITWPQHYDGKRWDNMIAVRFGVKAIPTTVLIDKQGIVRNIGLRGAQLENAVDNLCKANN